MSRRLARLVLELSRKDPEVEPGGRIGEVGYKRLEPAIQPRTETRRQQDR